MGLPALKERFESFAAETQSRSQRVTHAAEVVSISIGGLVRCTNSLTKAMYGLRSRFVASVVEIPRLFEKVEGDEASKTDLASAAEVMATMKWFRARLRHPNTSVIVAAERLEGMKTNTAADGRTARRLAGRIREASKDLEEQRVRVVAAMDDLVVRMEAFSAKHFAADEFRRAYTQALGEESIKRHPVVNAYLAR